MARRRDCVEAEVQRGEMVMVTVIYTRIIPKFDAVQLTECWRERATRHAVGMVMMMVYVA